ncbi:hypothetical protein BJX62DRAFT_225614 [Aspergillus germanicus]
MADQTKKSAQHICLILNAFQYHYNGGKPHPWVSYRLRLEEYADLLRKLESKSHLSTYIKRKSRYDYDPHRSRLTIRMPTALHETFCVEVVSEITRQLDMIKNSGCSEAAFVREIKPFAFSRIELPENENGLVTYILRESDASFGHIEAQYLSVFIGIAYSQKRQAVRDLADDYILCTDGSINVVATISIWRPGYRLEAGKEVFVASLVVDQEVFRTHDGRPLNSDPLRLSLKDFATSNLAEHYPDIGRHEIVIPSKMLYDFLSQAEKRTETQKQHRGATNRIRPGILKRRRPVTPGESDTQSEEEEPKRTRNDDSDYCPSP